MGPTIPSHRGSSLATESLWSSHPTTPPRILLPLRLLDRRLDRRRLELLLDRRLDRLLDRRLELLLDRRLDRRRLERLLDRRLKLLLDWLLDLRFGFIYIIYYIFYL